MKRLLLLLIAACGNDDEGMGTCEGLQRAGAQEFGECVVAADPAYSDGCPFALGGLCQPSGLLSDCDPAFVDLAGVGCDLGDSNCHYDFPRCEPAEEGRVKYDVRLVYDGAPGVVVLDVDSDTCTFRPCL